MISMLFAVVIQGSVPPPPPLHGGPAPMTCPVGGETFAPYQATHYSTYGERPDGRPYSYMPMPLPVPECPTNKLVVFDDFTPAEVETLAKLIAAPDYAALLTTDNAFYRGYWLATRLQRPSDLSLGLLNAAIWRETPGHGQREKGDAVRAARYRETLVREVERLPAGVAAKDRLWLQARAANALRELGRFEEAEAMRMQALTLAGSVPETSWQDYLERLAPVIARRDASAEPLDMIPQEEAGRICMDETDLSDFARSVCARPDVASETETYRKILAN
ncbi:hypothetical protein COC42_11790 [Sphingomonas spermidinifaciens]|uniref:Uncharacterized protein n=1 Tax=Sphingomonas spermidinifaciens TaxID=1141889 RepID=A0A2A4B2F2_9SPHN|nr:hypothetical protein [Sphingomonas spermidinifaciens]PCD02145.1 hypothetical protein COC42_11790 [Sphingomonas spermidinifaciens]